MQPATHLEIGSPYGARTGPGNLAFCINSTSWPIFAAISCGFFRIPLPVVLTDSTHGEMRAFELNTVRLTDADEPKEWVIPSLRVEMAPLYTRS